jgi:hypothetical protein
MEASALGAWLWLVHAAIAIVLSAPIVYFGRQRAHWRWYDLLAVVVPFAIWWTLFMSPLSQGKSMGNFAECIYLSVAVPPAAYLRVGIGTSVHKDSYFVGIIALLCGIAVAIFFLTPSLPE